MFTLEQIKTVHSKVKTGADFPAYVQDLKKLGVKWYETFTTDVRSFFHGENGYMLSSPPVFPPIDVADIPSAKALKEALSKHQKGETDFATVRKQAIEAGVNKWITDINKLTCTYFDKAGNILLVEEIPVPVNQ